MKDNTPFIITALFLTGLIALSSGLQKAPDVQSPVSQSQPAAQVDSTTAPAPAQATATVSQPAVAPQIHRYNRGDDDN